MKSILIAVVLSFAAGAAFATATFNAKQTAPLSTTQDGAFVSQAAPIVATSNMATGACFEIVGGEQHCR